MARSPEFYVRIAIGSLTAYVLFTIFTFGRASEKTDRAERQNLQMHSVIEEMCDRWEVVHGDAIGPLCMHFREGSWPH